jgi:hypothetical protein
MLLGRTVPRRPPTCRRPAALLLVISVAIICDGCGGNSAKPEMKASDGGPVIAYVAGTPIRDGTLRHWTEVEAVLIYEVFPKQPVPLGVVPDPPRFTRCVSYLEDVAERASTGAHNTPQQFKAACEARYSYLQRHILQILITYRWLEREAATRHLTLTSAELTTAFNAFVRKTFKGRQQFTDFLRYTKLTEAEERLRVEANQLVERLQHLVEKLAHGNRESKELAFGSYLKSMARRWAAKTSCAKPFLIADCRNFGGAEAPEALL